jgi:hypothetical protein
MRDLALVPPPDEAPAEDDARDLTPDELERIAADAPQWTAKRTAQPASADAPSDGGPKWLADEWDDDEDAEELPTLVAVEGGMPLLYAGESHALVGPGGRGKSMVTQRMVAEIVHAGGTVLLLDYESNLRKVRARLKALGVTKEGAGRIAYWRLVAGLSGDKLATLLAWCDTWKPTLTVLDSVARACGSLGIDDNSPTEYTRFHQGVVAQFEHRSLTWLHIDHTGHADGLGNGAKADRPRGASSKTDTISGASYTLKVAQPWTRTQDGHGTMTTIKDRDGNRAFGSVAAVVTVAVADNGGRISMSLTAPEEGQQQGGGFRPTVYMERVSRYLEVSGPASARAVEREVEGRGKYIREALTQLTTEGYAQQSTVPAPGGAMPFKSVKPYRENADEQVDAKTAAEPF